MKKKLIVLSAIMVLALTGCHSDYEDNGDRHIPNRFIVIDEEEDSYLSVNSITAYDKNTGVIYMFNVTGYGYSMCPLYNTDGTIMVYDGWDKTN